MRQAATTPTSVTSGRLIEHYLGAAGQPLDSATYKYGSGGRFKRATHARTISPPAPGTGTEVKPRDVQYVHGGADLEQITAPVDGDGIYASFVTSIPTARRSRAASPQPPQGHADTRCPARAPPKR
jgi:hypothetical protein